MVLATATVHIPEAWRRLNLQQQDSLGTLECAGPSHCHAHPSISPHSSVVAHSLPAGMAGRELSQLMEVGGVNDPRFAIQDREDEFTEERRQQRKARNAG